MQRSVEWLAGILEGEGCFTLNKGKKYNGVSVYNPTPVISCTMTDKDVMEDVADSLGSVCRPGTDTRKGSYKDLWRTSLSGVKALTKMLEIFPHMGTRRQARISELLASWEHSPIRKYVRRK